MYPFISNSLVSVDSVAFVVGHHYPTEKNSKDCMAITLRSGKELGDGKELANSKNAKNGKVDNEKIVDEEVDNKKVEDEKVDVEKQEVQVDKKEEKREETSLHKETFYFPTNPPQLSHHYRFHKDLEKPSWMGNSLHFLICSISLK